MKLKLEIKITELIKAYLGQLGFDEKTEVSYYKKKGTKFFVYVKEKKRLGI